MPTYCSSSFTYYLHNTHPFHSPLSGTTRRASTRKVKPIWILLKQKTVSGSGISWAICKSAPRCRQTTMSAPHHSVFTGRMPFLPPNKQRQSTEGLTTYTNRVISAMQLTLWPNWFFTTTWPKSAPFSLNFHDQCPISGLIWTWRIFSLCDFSEHTGSL